MFTRLTAGLVLTTLVISSVTRASWAQNAPGQPIYDRSCEQAILDATRLEADLAKQDEQIRRHEQMLASAEGRAAESVDQLQSIALEGARDLAIKQLEMVKSAREAIEKTRKSRARDAAAQRRLAALHQWVDRVVKSGEAVEEAVSAGELFTKRAEFESAVVRNRATLAEYAKFIEESGVSDDLGVAAAHAVAGPPGVLAVKTFIVLRDVALAAGNGYFSAAEAAEHRNTLNTLKVMRQKNSNFAFELRLEATRCTPTPRPADRMMVTEGTPANSTVKPPDASPTPAVEEKKDSYMGTILLGSAAIAGVAGYYAYTKMCVAPTVNPLTVCSSQGGSSSACKSALAEQDKYCKCEGYAGQSGGSCR